MASTMNDENVEIAPPVEEEVSYMDELRLANLVQKKGRKIINAETSMVGLFNEDKADPADATTFFNHRMTSALDIENEEDDDDEDNIILYEPPLQRQLWGKAYLALHVGWNALFFDLFFVAAAYNLGNLLMSGLHRNDVGRTLIYVAAIFGGLYEMFLRASLYEAQFTAVDYTHRFIELLRVFLLSMVVAHIKSIEVMRDPAYMESFALTLFFFLEALVQAALELELYFFAIGDKVSIQNQSKRRLLTQSLPILTCYLAACVVAGMQHYGTMSGAEDENHGSDNTTEEDMATTTEEHHRFLSSGGSEFTHKWNIADVPLLLIFAAVVVIHVVRGITAIMLSPTKQNIRSHIVPTNIDYLIHRLGEFTMIFFGEAVMALLIINTEESAKYYIPLVFGVLSVMILQALKYESEPHGQKHCLWRGVKALYIYSVLTELLCLFMVGLAISFKNGLIYVESRGSLQSEQSAEHDVEEESGAETEESAEGDHRRLSSGGPQMSLDADEELYALSLAFVLAIIVLMSFSHVGFKKMYAPGEHGRLAWKSVLRLTIQVGLILFVATMFLWDIPGDAPILKKFMIGFVVIVIFALIKVTEHLTTKKKNSKKN